MHLQVISPDLHRAWQFRRQGPIKQSSWHLKQSGFYPLSIWVVGLLCVFFAPFELIQAENVSCDPDANSDSFYCRGWQDDLGPNSQRVRFIARLEGTEYGGDFGKKVCPLGDINNDGRSDFMVYVPHECRWHVYLGDTLISRTPHMYWPTCTPGYPGNFFLLNDISGDGQPDLFQFSRNLADSIEIYFAGTAFDTLRELVIYRPEFDGLGFRNAIASGHDINGDGEPDFALGDPHYLEFEPKEHGRLYVFWGGSQLDSTPDLIFSDTFWVGQNQPRAVGEAIAIMPDLNGDGYADIVMGRGSRNLVEKDPPGRVDVFFGGPQIDTVADLTFVSPDTAAHPLIGYLPTNYFGMTVADIGDYNLDGHDDLIVSGYEIVPSYVYFGGPSFDGEVDLRLSGFGLGPDGEGNYATRLGDVSGDSLPDFAVVYESDGSNLYGGHVLVYFADAAPDGDYDWLIFGDDWPRGSSYFGRETWGLGDVDGDGFEDFSVGTYTSIDDEDNRGAVYIFAGTNWNVNTAVSDDEDAESREPSGKLFKIASENPSASSFDFSISDHLTNGTLEIFDILGRRVWESNTLTKSVRHISWSGRDHKGRPLSSGIYFARLRTREATEVVKIVLLR